MILSNGVAGEAAAADTVAPADPVAPGVGLRTIPLAPASLEAFQAAVASLE